MDLRYNKSSRKCLIFNCFLVGVRWFEHPTFWSRTRRSTKLSHTPILNFSFKLHAWKCTKWESLFKYPLRCPKLFARFSLRTILTADAFRTPFIHHRWRSCSSYQTEPHPDIKLSLHAWKCVVWESLFKYPLRCPKLFARFSLRTILTADAFRTPFIHHRWRSCSSYQTEPHPDVF